MLLLSGILLPMTIEPAWLNTLADWMPTRHIVDAVRFNFGIDFEGRGMLWGSVWAVVLCALAIWWGTRTFRKENA